MIATLAMQDLVLCIYFICSFLFFFEAKEKYER